MNNKKLPDIYDLGYDRHLNRKEFIEEQKQAFKEQEERSRKDREYREKIRLERISKSGKPELVYIIDKIIETCLLQRGKEKIEMNSYDLGIEDNIMAVQKVHGFLNTLKKKGCFRFLERSANTWFIINKKAKNKKTQKIQKKIS